MDFYDILDQVIDILRSRGRMSYRALKRQFDLDDDYMGVCSGCVYMPYMRY